MIIKKLNASFGNLNNDTLEFKDGLNIVQASNEAGKSTWCAFIRTMLYGINTADRDKAGYLSDKTRYMPWNGAPMEGTMDIHWGNSDISIRRSSLRAAPMKNFSAVYSDTSENVQWLNGENAGETLTGVPEKVFERSVFIRQAGLDINQTAELEKRMTSIVSSGDEHTSYSEADSRLREWLRKRRFKQSGQLPKLEGDIQSVEKKLSRLEEINSAAADLRLETEQATRTKKELEEELKTHDIIDRAMEYKRVLEAKQTAEDENAAVEEAKKHLIHNGRLATKNDIAAARDSLSHIQQLQMKISSSNSERDTLASEITSLKKEIDDSPFSGSTPEGADSAAESSISEYNTALAASQKKPRASTILFIISLISALGSFAVLWYMKLAQIFYAIPGGLLILAIVFLIVLISKNTSASKARKLGLSILEKYHASGTEEIKALAGKYRTAYDKAEETQDKLSETEATLELLSTELESTKAELENQLLAFSDEAAGIENANEIITKTDKLADELAQAEMRKSAADNIYTTLSKAAGDFSDFTLPKDLERPAYTRAQAQGKLNGAVRHLEKVAEDYAMSMGEARAIGDPAVLGAELSRLNERHQELEDQYEAISIAVDALKAANSDIQTRFSPILSHRAGEIMAALTGGRYRKLLFDSNLSAEAEVFGESVARNVISLSRGTADQLYLALRLAISELVLPKDETCPLILDDALVNFDTPRMELAMDWLMKAAENRQIILFTCHDRESSYAKAHGKVNITNI